MKRTLGVCYYPEHWPEAWWPEDARRMADIGLTWVRIGEFAWGRMEPEPGRTQVRPMSAIRRASSGHQASGQCSG